ncbi:MAG: glycosyltransferase family 2 protein, partial [Candidatus Altiarchaeota archaeon]
MYREKSVGVVVPAYNEEKLVAEAVRSMPEYVDRIFLVDDGSTDGTLKVAQSLRIPKLTVIRHETNRGVGAALASGYKAALEKGCELVAVLAGDGQMDPSRLTELLDPLIDGEADYTKGNRLMSPAVREGMPVLRLLGNSLLSFLTKVSSGYWDIMDPQNGYTATTRQVLETIPLDGVYPRYGYPNDLLIKLNAYHFRVLDVVMPPRYGSEKSKIRLWSYVPTVSILLVRGFLWRLKEKYVLQAFHPLVFFYLMGLTLVPVGVLSGFYMLYLRVHVGGITAASVLIPIFLIT